MPNHPTAPGLTYSNKAKVPPLQPNDPLLPRRKA